MTTITGRHRTPKASQYLQQLCKHFAHKAEAEWTETAGKLVLAGTPVSLTAADGALVATFDTDDAEIRARLQGVVDSHLKRFAFREEFEHMDWDTAAA